mgnify:CR=1 FL=1
MKTSYPRLYHMGEKSRDMKPDGNYKFYSIVPQDLMDAVFTTLTNEDGNLIKLTYTLAAQKGDGNFLVTNKWVCEHTGMSVDEYLDAKKKLLHMGWLKHTGKDSKDVYLDFNAIYDDVL